MPDEVRMLTEEEIEIVREEGEELELVLSPNSNCWYIYSNDLDAYYDTDVYGSENKSAVEDMIEDGEHLTGEWIFDEDFEV